MKTNSKLIKSMLGMLLAFVLCTVCLSACKVIDDCIHEWGEWTTKTAPTCTAEGVKEHKCTKCTETETAPVDALGHDWNEATCTSPKTCKVCAATEGDPVAHTYTVETVKDEALKTAATCTEAAVYYKSCACGAISTNAADTFVSGAALDHKDENRDHTCDRACGKNDMGTHADAATDSDHTCDYGCGATMESCVDSETDNDHSCDICGKADVSQHAYGNATCTSPATCTVCGATTGTALAHKDEDHNHVCDYNCGKNDMGTHADANNDADHVCDYGCGAVLEACYDKETDADHKCDACGKADVTSHAYIVTGSTPATCVAAATKTFTCNCGDHYTENDGDALQHDVAGATAVEKQVDGCRYVLVTVCQRKDCGVEVEGETVYHHQHVASITTPATCKDDGVKTLTCACGDSYTTPIEKDATGHDWLKGAVEAGVRTDTCAHCGNTKSVTVYEGTTTNETNANDLKDKEIELNDANISLDSGVIDAIGDQKITVSADKLEGDDRGDLGLSEDQLAQVGDSPIYNFTINNGSENISQFGENNFVTITLPYTLAEGEDVDSIAVWFINDQGKLESIEATYNNGFVTFKTNHFSYYTVTRLTPAERCELYGHGYSKQHVEGSCTKDSYDLYVCVRCHDKYVDEKTYVTADGHDYTVTTNGASCTQNGYVQYSCKDCDHSYKTTLAATGHSYKVEASQPASCTADGYTKYGCEGCDAEYTVTAAKLAHVYTGTVTPATCTTAGFTTHDCNTCDYVYTDSYVSALGHAYSGAVWTWATDFGTATVTFTCTNDAQHVMTLNANVQVTVTKGTCSNFTKTTYTATATYNGTVYTDEKVVEEGTADHVYSTEWKKNDTEHWYECVCGDKKDLGAHAFENETVTKAPTCTTAGESVATCVCGATKVTELPATSNHTYVDGVCSVCGATFVDTYYLNLVESWKNVNGFSIKIQNLTYEISAMDQTTGETVAVGNVRQIDVTELALFVEDGKLGGAAIGKIAIFNGPVVNEDATYGFKAVIDGDYVYITLEGDLGNGTDTQNVKMSVEAMLQSLISSMPVDEEAYVAIEFAYEKLLPIVEAFIKTNDEKANQILEDAFNIIFTFQKQADGTTVATLDYAKLKTLNENLATKNVAEVVDVYFGEGAFDALVKTATEILGLKLSEIPAYLDAAGLDSAALIKVINEFAAMTGAPEGYDIGAMLNAPEYAAFTVGMLLFEVEDDSYLEEFNKAVSYLKVISLYELIDPDMATQLQEGIAAIIDMVSKSINVSFATTADGMLTKVMLDLDEFEFAQQGVQLKVSLDLVLEINGKIDVTWSDLIEQIEKEIVLPTDDMLEDDLDAHYNYGYSGSFEYQGMHYYYEDGVRIYAYKTDYSKLSYILYMADCVGWTSYEASYWETEYEFTIADTYVGDEDVRFFVNESTGEAVMMVTEVNNGPDTIIAIYEDGTQKTFTESMFEGYEDMAGMYAALALAIFGEEGGIMLPGGYVNYYYNATTKEYATETRHDFVENVVVNGDNCREDGCTVTTTCTKCDYRSSYTNRWCETEYVEIDLSDKVACGATVYGYRCIHCNTMESLRNIDFNCKFEILEQNTLYDEFGNPIGDESVEVCRTCGTKRVSSSYTEQLPNCQMAYHRITAVYVGDECIYEFDDEWFSSNHQYQYSYEMHGESCEDGYIEHAYCTVCGLTRTSEGSGHNTERIEVELSEHGLCGGYVYQYVCRICNTTTETNINDYECDWSWVENGEPDGGAYFCRRCGTTKNFVTSITETGVNCEFLYLTRCEYYAQDGSLLYSIEATSKRIEHDYECYYELHGESCEDGYTVYLTCKKCGANEQWKDSGHDYDWIEVELSEYGLCGGFLQREYCTICKKVLSEEAMEKCNWRPTTVEDNYARYSCPRCGAVKEVVISNATNNGCVYEFDRVTVYSINGTEVLTLQGHVTDERHEYVYEYVLMGSSCEDGVIRRTSCKNCDIYYEFTNYYHETVGEHVELSEKYDVCYGWYSVESCVCGEISYVELDTCCHVYTENSYYDENGILVTVEVRSCPECGLRYTVSRYNEAGEKACESIVHTTYVLTLGNELIMEAESETRETNHTYVVHAALMGGEGSTCEEGVILTYTCEHCDYFFTEESYGHVTYIKETIDLSKYGNVCGGYAYIDGCACGKTVRMQVETLCDHKRMNMESWVTNALTGNQPSINGYTNFNNDAWIYVCAVTDPAERACGFAYAYANYWLREEGTCYAHRYQTWLFGYDRKTGTYQYQVLIDTGVRRQYHDYVDTSANGDIRLDCKACGSSYYETYSYDDQGRVTVFRKEVKNTLNDNNARYLEEVCEYTYDAVTGEQTGFREYVRHIYSDGRETWSERLETPYVGSFGEPGRESIERGGDQYGNTFEKSYAYVYYKGYNYTIYSYYKDSQKGYEWWERYDFTYTFDKECLQTEVYTNSKGDTSTNVNNCCYYEWGAVIQAPTCSQDGLVGNSCPVCMNSGETDTIKALDHNWVWLSNNLYHCARCGLENANGVSGDVVLEDLSAAYGNGENYVAGYYTHSYVAFSWYVSLILPNGEEEEIIVDGVKFIELDGLRAVAFSKAEVAAWASKMGYADYDVRFSFVPVGSDGSFDYGLTFAAKTAGDVGVITDDVSFTDYIGVGEVKTYTITPTESGQWYFVSCSDGDTCATLYSSYGKELAYGDDNVNGNFRIDYYLKAGQTYTIEVRWNDSNAQGSLVLLFGAEKTVTEEKPEEDKPEGECNHNKYYTHENAATCTKDGYKEDVCKDCGMVLYRENWKANGHAFDDKGICMNCGASEGDVNEEDKPEGECDHKNQYTNEVPATCTEDGYKEDVCKDCGMVLYRETWKSNGHAFDEKGVCMNCGASEGETGEATDAELSKQIEEAVSTAQRVWGELADMGVSRSVLKTYQAQYDLIVETMQNADSFESLEKCQQQFDEMIAKITATL